MKKRLQGFIAGFLCCSLLAGVSVFASVGTEWIEAYYNDIKIYVDGKKINPKDVNGNSVEPFVYNGTTYLPVRAVGNAFGKEVYWDGETSSVFLGDMDGGLEYPSLKLLDATDISGPAGSFSDRVTYSSQLKDNYENTYNEAREYYGKDTPSEYILNSKYSRFKGTLYIHHGEDYRGSLKFIIEADGKVIYTSPEMNKRSKPVDIDVSIKGCNVLKIKCVGGSDFDVYEPIMIHLGDAGFYQ